MIEPKVKDTKVVFGPCRLSYTHVFNKYTPDGDASTGKYMTNVLIPKSALIPQHYNLTLFISS